MSTSSPILTPGQILKQIRTGFRVDEKEVQLLCIQTDRIITQHSGLMSIADLTFLQKIDHPWKYLIRRAGFISPKALFVSEKIKSLCRLNYKHADMRIDPCGGIKKNYLACSPYSLHENKIKQLFSGADLFCFLEADGLTDMKQQKYLHEILFQVEDYFKRIGITIVMTFCAGPCRICEKCAGQYNEECYEPEKKRFSLEACGIDVDWAMKMMAKKSGDVAWTIMWLKDYRLDGNTNVPFKSVMGALLTTK